MAYYYRNRRSSSIFDGFFNPLPPYPILLILAVISILLGTSWYFSYESAVESAEEQMNWVLLTTPIILLLLVRWLLSMENPEALFGLWGLDRHHRTYNQPSLEGNSWGVAVFIVLLLVLVQFHSIFRDSWSVSCSD